MHNIGEPCYEYYGSCDLCPHRVKGCRDAHKSIEELKLIIEKQESGKTIEYKKKKKKK